MTSSDERKAEAVHRLVGRPRFGAVGSRVDVQRGGVPFTSGVSVTPTSKTMADAIEKRRRRLANRAMPASATEAAPTKGPRKLVK